MVTETDDGLYFDIVSFMGYYGWWAMDSIVPYRLGEAGCMHTGAINEMT